MFTDTIEFYITAEDYNTENQLYCDLEDFIDNIIDRYEVSRTKHTPSETLKYQISSKNHLIDHKELYHKKINLQLNSDLLRLLKLHTDLGIPLATLSSYGE